MRISIHHRTVYRYERPIVYTIQSLKQTPQEYASQTILRWRLRSADGTPMPSFLDSFGNRTHTLVINKPHDVVEILVDGLVETRDSAGVVRGAPEPFPIAAYLRETALTEPDGALKELAEGCRGAADLVGTAHCLMDKIRARIDYRVGATHVETTAAAALAAGYGVCQDHAHAFIACARHLGLPARYVSGYLAAGDGSEVYEASHAWAEIFIPDLGWVGFDPANAICPNQTYVRVATGLDYRESAPVRGLRKGLAEESLDVAVRVIQEAEQQQA